MNWNLDKAHSSITFAVRHMGLATVRGTFERFDIDLKAGADGVPTSFEARIEADSLSTGEAKRDAHLRSADFFDVDTYPEILFVSNQIDVGKGGRYLATGSLDMHGQVHDVTFEFDLATPITDPYGMRRVAAEGTGSLNRKQWGLTWNQILEAGAMLVGEDIRFTFDVQGVAAQPTEKELVGAA